MTELLQRATPLYRQICSLLEGQILDGKLCAGDRLPKTDELAAHFGVTVQTAQQAAALLSERGLIERVPGRGSFVSRRILSRTIGIVCGENIFGHSRYLFNQQVYACLFRELKRLGWHSSLYFPLDAEGTEQMLAELGQDLANDRLRGVIPLCGCGSDALTHWFAQRPGIPHMYVDESFRCPAADSEGNEMARGVAYLLDRGYRRLAVIVHTETTAPEAVEEAKASIPRAYAERGLPLQATFHGGRAASHADGVAQARTILDAPGGPPEAIYVLNDQGAIGVIFELMRRKLDIPADIGVMAVSNKGIEVPCPVPLTRLEHDPFEFAQCEIEALMAVLDGREPDHLSLGARLIVGESCGEGLKPNSEGDSGTVTDG